MCKYYFYLYSFTWTKMNFCAYISIYLFTGDSVFCPYYCFSSFIWPGLPGTEVMNLSRSLPTKQSLTKIFPALCASEAFGCSQRRSLCHQLQVQSKTIRSKSQHVTKIRGILCFCTTWVWVAPLGHLFFHNGKKIKIKTWKCFQNQWRVKTTKIAPGCKNKAYD